MTADRQVYRPACTIGVDEKPTGIRCLRYCRHLHPASNRRGDRQGIVFDELGDLLAMGKPVRIIAAIPEAGKLQRPVWKLKMERVPPLAAPSLRNTLSLENDMLAPAFAQMIAHGQAGLAAADHHRIVPFSHRMLAQWDVSGPAIA